MEVISDVIEYPGFDPGQTLTSSQLNNLVKYFSLEEEDTRVFLVGRGIFYGLEVDYNSVEKSITVRPGAGLSSNGQLFALEDGFKYTNTKNEPVTIAGFTVDAQVLTRKKEGSAIEIKDNSIVIMQIQTNEEANNDCLQRFDRAGKKTKLQIRVAVIDSAVFTNAIINGWGNKNKPDEMKEILAPYLHRFGNSDITLPEEQQAISFDGFTSWQKVKDNFNSVCEEGAAKIGGVYQTVYDTYAAQLGYSAIPNRFQDLPKKLADKLKEVYESNGYRLPYFYDYLKDLVNACIEFLDTTIDVPEFSYPDKESFMDYISLGRALQPAPDDKYRMGWYRLPSSYNDRESIDKPKMLMERMIRLTEVRNGFISDEQLNKEPGCIAPSVGLGFPLSARPIPFYVTNKDDLRNVWNYGASRHRRLGSIAGMSDSEDRKLLLRDLDAFSFFKIKGHAGHSLDVAKKEIEKLRKDLHLPFDIKVLFLGDEIMEGGIFSDYKGYFSDLRLQWESAYASLMCDESCGTKVIELIRSEWNGADDDYWLFESIGYFFIKYEFDPEPSKWKERAMDFCNKLCEEKDPQCCLNYLRFFYDLYMEYKARKEEILDELFFHRFAKKHPGLEHNAGVYKGGTLVLVCAMELQHDKNVDRFWEFVQNNKEIHQSLKADLLQNMLAVTVVADFCLPYICCSKRPSIRAEFYQTAPLADFEVKEQVAIKKGEETTGYTMKAINSSRNADSYYLTIFNSKNEIIPPRTAISNKFSFDLNFKDDENFSFMVQLEAVKGNLTSIKQKTFDFSKEMKSNEKAPSLEERAKGYKASLHEMTKDKSLLSNEKYKATQVFLHLTKKSFDRDFEFLLDTLQKRFDKYPPERKQQVIQLAMLATFFYLDKQVLSSADVSSAKDNKLIETAISFIKSNKIKTEKLLAAWHADMITTEKNKALVETYKSMME